MNHPNKKKIPHPHLESYMHKRIELKKRSWDELLEVHNKSPPKLQMLLAMMTRVIKKARFHKPTLRWTYTRVAYQCMWLYFKIFHRIEVRGKENIPKNGGIFICNHPDKIDVVLALFAAFRKPIGLFSAVGDGVYIKLLESIGFVPRLGTGEEMTEKMIREILLKNKYFVMWPEGTPDKGNGVMQGFSSIVKVYATLNSQRDLIPFVPTIQQISFKKIVPNARKVKKLKTKFKKLEGLQLSQEVLQRKRKKLHQKWKRVHGKSPPEKIVTEYLKPCYLPREWLKRPEEGGKTKREIMDYLMLKIARKMGKKELAQNPRLEDRKKNYDNPWD